MARSKPFFGWWILSASSLTIACSGLMQYGIPAFYPALIGQFGWSRAGITLGHSIILGANSVMQIVFGMVIDRRGVRKVLLLGTVMTGGSYLLFRFVNGLQSYYLACLLVGIGWSAMAYVPNSALVSNWFQRRRGLALGIVTAASALGGAISAPIITYLVFHTGWRNTYTWLGIVGLLLPLVPLLTIVRDRPDSLELSESGEFDAPPQSRAASSVRGAIETAGTGNFWGMIRQNPSAMVLFPGLFLLGMFIGSIQQHLILYLRGEGFAPYVASGMLGLEMVFGLVGRLGFGITVDKVSLRVACVIFLLLLVSSSGLVFLVTVSGMVFLFAICHGLGHGAVTAFIPIVCSTAFPRQHLAKNIALGFAVYALGVAAGPPLLGWIFDKTGSYFYGFLINAVLVTAATIGILTSGLWQPRAMKAVVETAAG